MARVIVNRLLASMPAFLRKWFRSPGRTDLYFIARLWLLTLLAALAALLIASSRALAVPLSAGDRVQLTVIDGDEFSGTYHLDVEGALPIPLLGRVPLAGREPGEAEHEIARRLVTAGYFRADHVRATLQVLDWSELEVAVAGAVYAPGRVLLGDLRDRGESLVVRPEAPGAARPARYLRDALKAAGGVRPDADLARVEVDRGDHVAVHDLRGYLTGDPVPDVVLAAGDRVNVPSSGVENPALIRPSAITPPGIKIFASNLVQPSYSNSNANAPASGIAVPYGSRLSQAVVAANCAGGAAATNANRAVYLVRTDRNTGETVTWRAKVGALLDSRQSGADAPNPLLMEGDSLVCTDSAVTNVREIFRAAADVLLPFRLGRLL